MATGYDTSALEYDTIPFWLRYKVTEDDNTVFRLQYNVTEYYMSVPDTVRQHTGKFDIMHLMVRSNDIFVQYSQP